MTVPSRQVLPAGLKEGIGVGRRRQNSRPDTRQVEEQARQSHGGHIEAEGNMPPHRRFAIAAIAPNSANQGRAQDFRGRG